MFAFCVEAVVTSRETVQMNCASTAMNLVIYPRYINIVNKLIFMRLKEGWFDENYSIAWVSNLTFNLVLHE